MSELQLDRPPGDRPQFLLQQILQQAVIARVEPDLLLCTPVVAFRTPLTTWMTDGSSVRNSSFHVKMRVTYEVGDESQICLFGGCLLITYVPASPRCRVKTPL